MSDVFTVMSLHSSMLMKTATRVSVSLRRDTCGRQLCLVLSAQLPTVCTLCVVCLGFRSN